MRLTNSYFGASVNVFIVGIAKILFFIFTVSMPFQLDNILFFALRAAYLTKRISVITPHPRWGEGLAELVGGGGTTLPSNSKGSL